MKNLLRLALIPLIAAAALAADFRDHLGLQLYSLRAQTKESTTGALDLAKSYGVKEVELAGTGTPPMPADKFLAELTSRGLKPVSAHYGYQVLEKDLATAIKDAKTLGVKFVVVPYPPVGADKLFSEELARKTAAQFNAWGKAFREAGIRFGYHPHGLEFRPTANGETVFDILVRETDPNLVCFQMDVYWVYYAGQDPVKLLKKYPNRWVTMHIKDMLKGLATGVHTGGTPPTAKVTVGQGQIDYVAVLRAGQEVGIQHYFLEDETPTPLQCIPDSLKYLRGLKL